jgi:hypothetical protein
VVTRADGYIRAAKDSRPHSRDETYRFDGTKCNGDANPSLFFANPNIVAPPQPKRKIKKTVYVGIGRVGDGGTYHTSSAYPDQTDPGYWVNGTHPIEIEVEE